ncbi:MAG: hypothetical protein QOG23_1965 [Blastocatellia bacterium]|jgi:hypothetical protein|nr:hypothetical protein [Blastocatellia bacterium]
MRSATLKLNSELKLARLLESWGSANVFLGSGGSQRMTGPGQIPLRARAEDTNPTPELPEPDAFIVARVARFQTGKQRQRRRMPS